ncbi:Inactive serine protease PAMR1 [Collichthys lucidus]|uniref:Inactive serine protease PAMR1 n=1 Tax=Collichthys lucidus TaxID=240159 RepID=A0A4U5U5K2_COLLU|nr:Inactive serine protease PAMR1 [Collichthys lucidus]
MCLGARSLLCVTFAMEQHDVVHNHQWMEVEKCQNPVEPPKNTLALHVVFQGRSLNWQTKVKTTGNEPITPVQTGRSVHNTGLALLSWDFLGTCIVLRFAANMLTFLTRKVPMPTLLDPKLYYLLLNLSFLSTAWPREPFPLPISVDTGQSSEDFTLHLAQNTLMDGIKHVMMNLAVSPCSRVGYTVPCCRNALDQCDPCIIHPGCSLFENCKTCHNGTWKANDNFFVNGKYCTECRQGWSGGDCKTCGGVIQRTQGHIALESYPTNAQCEWTVQVERGRKIELRFSVLSLESDHTCRYDYVEVRDGDGLSSPVIGRFCGDQLPPPMKSSGNLLHILFTSDGYNNYDGFVLTYQESSGRPASNTAGGAKTIEFFCKKSYILSGNHLNTCFTYGSWSSRPPKCVRACREPRVSDLVRQNVVKPHLISRENPRLSSRFSMHDLLSAGFIPLKLDKQSKKDKEEDSSAELPHGFHQVYTSIEYKCASALYHNTGSSRRTCMKSGRWSGRHVSCSPVCGKLDTFSLHNLTDTQWPWHAAIYIRSPPDHTASTHGPPGATLSIQQGASEESTFWYLACSGALLTQRSVLVAAQCVVDKDKQQTLHPAQVKVVIGVQTSTDRLKSLHHLRVSDISVHPNFYSAPDFDVAVLKLKDKAKISERALPACLPKVQGGEVTAQEAYTARWILPNDYRHPNRHTPLSQTKLVQLGDAAQCEREFAQGGARTPVISDNTLCVIRKPSSLQSPCLSVVPGITAVPAVFSSTSGVLSGHKENEEASRTSWQLLSLESFSYMENNCHQQTYTVQTRIANFRDWIEKNM